MSLNIKYDIRPRQTGKTYDLIQKSAETKYPIIVRNIHTVKWLTQKAEERGLVIPTPIPIKSILDGKAVIENTDKVLVDEAECMLDLIIRIKTGCHIDTMTLVTRNEKGHEIDKNGDDINVKYGLDD